MKTSRLDPPLFGAVHRPGVRFLLSHPAHVVALGFGSGLSPFAPGTVGTLAAWLAHALLRALDEAVLYVARAEDQAAARTQMAAVLGALLSGLRAAPEA